jgi:hypothetical protein
MGFLGQNAPRREDQGKEASFNSWARSSGSSTDWAVVRNDSRTAWERGLPLEGPGELGIEGATFTTNARTGRPAAAAAFNRTSSLSRSLLFQIGALTRKTSLSLSTFARRHCPASAAGRLWRSKWSSRSNHRARSIRDPSPAVAACKACGGAPDPAAPRS